MRSEGSDCHREFPYFALSEKSVSIVGSVPDDQPLRAFAAYVGPTPLQEYTESKARFGQKLDMYESPYEPSYKAAQLDSRTLQNREISSNDGKIALVKIAKRRQWRLSIDHSGNRFRCILALLHCNLRNPR